MKELETLNDNYIQALEKLVGVIRETRIIPICKRHRLEFWSGSGWGWFFSRGDKHFTRVDDSPKYLHSLIELLNLPTATRFELGAYCDSWKP